MSLLIFLLPSTIQRISLLNNSLAATLPRGFKIQARRILHGYFLVYSNLRQQTSCIIIIQRICLITCQKSYKEATAIKKGAASLYGALGWFFAAVLMSVIQ